MLLALTPNDGDGAAWSLVSPPERPALLQAPVPGGDLSEFKLKDEDSILTPDELDVQANSKKHDLKSKAIRSTEPEYWLFALVSLQTQENYWGKFNYGISRIAHGNAARPVVGIEPSGGPGNRFRRDLTAALASRESLLDRYPDRPSKHGVGLVWLLPCDGALQLQLKELDIFYVEVCRRVRLGSGALCRTAPQSSNGRGRHPIVPSAHRKHG